MKSFFTILGCFMLFLSCMPCNDTAECEAKIESTLSVAADHGRHEHESEACTPFCTCSCCTVTVYYNIPFKDKPAAITTRPVKHPIRNTSFDTDVFYGIWQPPQLS